MKFWPVPFLVIVIRSGCIFLFLFSFKLVLNVLHVLDVLKTMEKRRNSVVLSLSKLLCHKIPGLRRKHIFDAEVCVAEVCVAGAGRRRPKVTELIIR